MEFIVLLLWIAFCALIARLRKAGAETMLLGAWSILLAPVLVSTARLLLG